MKRFISLFSTVRNFYERNERVLAISAMVLGFVIDNLTLRRIDLLFENLALISYLIICMAAILIINLHDSGKTTGKIMRWLRLFSPITLQFAFGGLFSAFFVFYFRSASVGASWPFILFLLTMMIGNEIFSKKFEQLTFQVGVFFIALLSYSILAVPIIVKEIRPRTFVLSLFVSFILIYLFLYILSKINTGIFVISKKYIFSEIFGIIVIVAILYSLNAIPPIPLSIKEKSLAYEVTRSIDGNYNIKSISQSFPESIIGGQTVLLPVGQPLYAFSSVFAPTRLSTNIVHEWQIKSGNRWYTVERIPFNVTGGSDRGYRGYTFKNNISEGEWRVNIETERGATIGRIKFEVKSSDKHSAYDLKTY